MSDDVSPLSTINLTDMPDLTQTTPPQPSRSHVTVPATTGASTIRQAVFEEFCMGSSFMTNYGKNLVFKLFSPAVQQGSNCSELNGKRALAKNN